MNFSASTDPPEPVRVVPNLIGFGSTDPGSIRALLGGRQRSAPVGSGTSLVSLAALHPGMALSYPTERVLEDSFRTEGDVIVQHCDEHRSLVTFDSPMLNVTAGATRPIPFLPSTQRVVDRVLFPPARVNLRRVLDATTAEQPIKPSSGVLSTTDPLLQPSRFLWHEASRAFMVATDEVFEGGIESEFSRTLDSLLRTHGSAAVEALKTLLFSSRANLEVAVESLKWLGRVDHGESRQHRRELLERLLHSPCARIRYGAAFAIAAMDDPVSLPAIHRAIKRESHRRLRQYFQLVVDQLETTERCLSS